MTESIVEFLTARLDEAEANAGQLHREDCSALSEWVGSSACDCGLPVFVLADIAAKRKVIELHYARRYGPTADLACAACGTWYEYPEASPCATVKALAEPFSGHPDYRQEWRLTDG